MEDVSTSKTTSGCDADEVAKLRSLLKEREMELRERKRFDEELYSLVRTLERRLTESAVQLVTARQEMVLEKQRQLECQLEIARLTDIMMREQDALTIVNQELEAFNYGISHDLRAPLRHLLGFAGILLEDYGSRLDGTAQKCLASIHRAGRKMESQIEALLTLSRISRQEVRTSRVDLAEMARGCAESLQESDPDRKVAFMIPERVFAQADATMIKAAMDHLLSNAWKYTCKKETATVELGIKEEMGGTVYYLRDNGAGFDMRYADRLFGPFQRLHNESDFEGIGIGLATVQRIIHRHGGKIWADGEVDAGATFYFTLPD